MRRVPFLLAFVVLAAACGGDDTAEPSSSESTAPAVTSPEADDGAAATDVAEGIAVSSDAFADGETIPTQHTCDGANTPPPLTWSGVPDAAAGLVLLVDDPDAPGGAFVHWLVALEPDATSPPTAAEGVETDAGTTGYFGPCPPPGDEPHRYRFNVIALDTPLDAASVSEAEAAIAEHEIGRGTLTGVFGR